MDPRAILRDPWLWVGLASTVVFVALGVLVVRLGAPAADERLAELVRSLPVPQSAWEVISDVGGRFRAVVAIALVLLALVLGRLRLALILAVVFLVAPAFSDLAKDVFGRSRPPDPLVVAAGWAYPSGHSLGSTVVYGLMGLVAWRSPLPAPARWLLVAVGVAIPLLTGLSRIGLGVHWPTDVLGGWAAGLAFVALTAVLICATGAMERDLPVRARARAADG